MHTLEINSNVQSYLHIPFSALDVGAYFVFELNSDILYQKNNRNSASKVFKDKLDINMIEGVAVDRLIYPVATISVNFTLFQASSDDNPTVPTEKVVETR